MTQAPKNFRPEPYEYHEELTLRVEDLTNLGRGIARDGDWVVQVAHVLPGETIKARVYRNHQNYSVADCIEVLPTADEKDAVEQTPRMLLLSERMQVDWFGTFAAAAAQVCVSHEVGFGKEQAAEGSQECKECSGCAWAVVLNTSGFIVDV